MTAAEKKREFLILYDKVTNFDAPGYDDLEISTFLTKAQEHLVKSIFDPKANRFQEGFEETEARRKDLKELVSIGSITTADADQTGVYPNGVFYTMPDDCLYVISASITTSSTIACQDNKRVKVKPVTHDEVEANVENPYQKPSIDTHVWRLDIKGNRHELITGATFSIAKYDFRYIETLNPIIISTDTIDGVVGPQECRLHESTHRRIIEEAVRIAAGVTDPQMYQIKTIEQQKGEY